MSEKKDMDFIDRLLEHYDPQSENERESKEIEFDDDFNSDGFIFVKQDQPLPCSVLALYPTLVTSDG